MHVLQLLQETPTELSGAGDFAHAPQHGAEDDNGDEAAVGEEVRALFGFAVGLRGGMGGVGLVVVVPFLPVFPGGVAEGRCVVGEAGPGVLVGGGGLCVFRLAVGVERGLGGPPAEAVAVVGTAGGGAGEDGVCGYDEPVAFELCGVGEGREVGGGAVVFIGVVDFYEFVETLFVVGGALLEAEDFVGRGELSGGGGGPGEVV